MQYHFFFTFKTFPRPTSSMWSIIPYSFCCRRPDEVAVAIRFWTITLLLYNGIHAVINSLIHISLLVWVMGVAKEGPTTPYLKIRKVLSKQ